LTEISGFKSQSCLHLVITHSILGSIIYNFTSTWVLCLKVLLYVILYLLLKHKVLLFSSLHCIEILFFLFLSKLLISSGLNTESLPVLYITNRYIAQEALLAGCCSSERVTRLIVIGYSYTLSSHRWLILIYISRILAIDTKRCCGR
jgi:hypothetical protein